MRKCKYCENPTKINYSGIKRRHKGYLRTCGSKECLSKQYSDVAVNAKKMWISRNIMASCVYCSRSFIKTTTTHKWCQICVPDKQARSIMQRYGLPFNDYLELIRNAGGICRICQKRPPSVVDHCHRTGVVRGFICNPCNMGLNVIEDKQKFKRALEYLGYQKENYATIS